MWISRGDNDDAHDNNADHHRDPEAARRARQAARLPDARALAARRQHGARRPSGDGADDEGVERRRRARARRGRRHAGDRRRREGGPQDRALGLPLLRGEGAQGEVRPRPERGEAVPAARQDARGDVLGRGPALRLHVHAASTACRSITPTCASTKSRAAASTSASGTSIPTRATASSSGAWMNEYRTQERFDGRGHADRLEQRQLREGQAGRAGADLVGRRGHACSTSSATRCTGSTRTCATRRSPAPTSSATSSSSRASSTSTGCRRTRCSSSFALHYQTGKPMPDGAGRQDRARRQALQPGLRDRRVPGVRDLST